MLDDEYAALEITGMKKPRPTNRELLEKLYRGQDVLARDVSRVETGLQELSSYFGTSVATEEDIQRLEKDIDIVAKSVGRIDLNVMSLNAEIAVIKRDGAAKADIRRVENRLDKMDARLTVLEAELGHAPS